MNRKRIITLSIVAILGLGAGLIWYLLAYAPGQPRPGQVFGRLPILGGRAPLPGAPTPLPLPQDGQGEAERVRLKQIVTKDILAPTIAADGKQIYYLDRSNGHIMSSDLDGNDERNLTNLTILETFDGVWSPAKNRVVIFYHENGVVKKFVAATATTTPSYFLPQGATAASWSPDGKRIAYLLRSGEETRVVIAEQNNRNTQVVHRTPIPDFTISWAAKNSILLVSRPSGLAPSLIMSLDPATQRVEPLLAGRRGMVILPAPDGGGFAFSQSSPNGAAEGLWRYKFRGAEENRLDTHTIAEKCAFTPDTKKIFCGQPKGLILSPSPDEWYKGAVSFSDTIVSIDFQTSRTETLMESGADVDMISPFVSPDGRYLFFQNKKDGTLWRLDIGD